MKDLVKSLLSALKNRYATKVFDATKKIESEKVAALLESLLLTPSSVNSQPWHVFVVSNQKEKQRLAAAAWDYNQPKYIDADYLFVFCAKTDFVTADVVTVETLVSQIRGIELSQQRVDFVSSFIEGMDDTEKKHWLKKQVYIMLGQFLTSCAILKLDACPIEGFLVAEMDRLLALADKGLTSVVTVAVGYRSADDFNQLDRAAKARFPAEKVLTILD